MQFEKSQAFFVISNFNTNPFLVAKYSKDFIIYDQSNKVIQDELKSLRDKRIIFSDHVGHNLQDYLNYIIDNYENLPPLIAFVKGNIIERHINKEAWQKIYRNLYYTFLYSDRTLRDVRKKQFSTFLGDFCEVNSSWFVWHSSHRYFINYNNFLNFIYVDPIIPQYVQFSPGGCYIVEKERIIKNPKSLYIGLKKIISYQFFPSEAWLLERFLHTLFTANYDFHPYVLNEKEFLNEIDGLPDLTNVVQPTKSKLTILIKRIKFKLIKIRLDLLISVKNWK